MYNVSSLRNQWGGMNAIGQLNNYHQAQNKIDSVEVTGKDGFKIDEGGP